MSLLSLSAVNAGDLNDNGMDMDKEYSNILNENSLNDEETILNEDINENKLEASLPNDNQIGDDPSTSNEIYVDINNGDDSNDGKSLENPVKSFEKALNLSENNFTIYLPSGEYSGLGNTGLTSPTQWTWV